MDSMHSTLNMYYDYDVHVKGELLDCDGIPKRPAMFLNLWRYKVVRHRYSNPMIQSEPDGSTQGYPLVSVEVLSHGPSDAKHNPSQPLKVSQQTLVSFLTKITCISIDFLTPKHLSDFIHNEDGNPAWANIKQAHGRLYTSAGNPVKEILLKLNLPDHRILKDGGEDFRYSDTERLSRSDEVLKLKIFKKDATLKLSKSTNQKWYEHVGPDVTRSQDDKVTRWRNEIMLD
ncbi:hypothetical protein Tco_1272713 [Tanacetum coccineum]